MQHPELVPDEYFHIYNHAVGNEDLFRSSNNYEYFLKKYNQYIYPVCGTFAYFLMPNHFHILIKVRTKDQLISYYIEEHHRKYSEEKRLVVMPETFDYHEFVMHQFKRFLNGYAQAFNKMYKRRGSLFVDYIKRKEIDNDTYLRNIIHYIHYNPVHHGFCKHPEDWTYSSFNILMSNKSNKL